MIQSSDQDILNEFEKLPHHLQYKITEFFKEFFSDVFLFNSVTCNRASDTFNSFYDIKFSPDFLIKGNRHLKGDKIRGLDAARYTQYRTQTVAEMRSVLDLFIYKLKEFTDQFNSKNLGVSIFCEPSGLSYNANLSHDCKHIDSFTNITFVYGREILQLKDLIMSDKAQIAIHINEVYSESRIRIFQWNSSKNSNIINPISL